jgi:hypothetical protein
LGIWNASHSFPHAWSFTATQFGPHIKLLNVLNKYKQTNHKKKENKKKENKKK